MKIKGTVSLKLSSVISAMCLYSPLRHCVRAAAVAALCALLSSCSVIPDNFNLIGKNGTNNNADNNNVARIVKAQLVASDLVEAAPLRISVEGQAIILKGFVESPDESREAERLTQELYPEFTVVNGIRVR